MGHAWVTYLSLWGGLGREVEGFCDWQFPEKQGEGLGRQSKDILYYLQHSLLF